MRALELRPRWLPLDARRDDRDTRLSPWRVRLREWPMPEPLAQEHLAVAVRLAGVPDQHPGWPSAPAIGSELIGRVTAPGLHPLAGRLVVAALQPARTLGEPRQPVLAEFLVVHEELVHPLPDGVDEERCLFAAPYARLLSAFRRHPPDPGEPILILSSGVLGLLATLCLRMEFGCTNLHLVAESGRERRLGQLLGARHTYGGREGPAVAVQAAVGARLIGYRGGRLTFSTGFGRVLDCAGTAWSIAEAFSVAREGGVIELCSPPPERAADLALVAERGLELRGLGRLKLPEAALIRDALSQLGRDEARPVTDLITGRYRIEQYAQLLRAYGARGDNARPHLRLVFDLRPESSSPVR